MSSKTFNVIMLKPCGLRPMIDSKIDDRQAVATFMRLVRVHKTTYNRIRNQRKSEAMNGSVR